MATSARKPLRVMVDANVLIAGSVWPRFPYEVLRHAQAQDFRLVLSPLVIAEARQRIDLSFPDNAWRLSQTLTSSSYEPIANPTREEVLANSKLVRDINDVPIALAAINANVDYLVTQDRDFTDLDESSAELHTKLKILLPGTFLREHMGWTSEALQTVRNRTWRDLQ